MLKFLFNKKEGRVGSPIHQTQDKINEIYSKLKEIYKVDEISDERKAYLKETVEKYGYLNYPHIKVLEELCPAEVLFALEVKFEINGVFENAKFNFAQTSPLERKNIKNADWIKKEGHDIKLINLAALGNGNVKDDTGKFIDWMRQLLILPTGVEARGILPTTLYLIPFQERKFGCAYLPINTDVSPQLEDSQLKKVLGLDAKAQVQTFITFAQLAGHPVIYDVLPQTGRFAGIVLANPYIARWFDIKELSNKIKNCLDLIANNLEEKFDKEDTEIVKNIYKQNGSGELSEDYQKIYDEFEKELQKFKKTFSDEMAKQENQIKIQKRVKEIVYKIQEENSDKKIKNLSENDLTSKDEIIKELMNQGLWTLPGGAWCSAGVPVFDKMSDCGSYPLFKHYDIKENDVTALANLDCQTPFYFTFLENGQLNKPVVEFFINYMKEFEQAYNFDGLRIDHVDHIVDDVSEKDDLPISYRIPRKVLSQLNSKMKETKPFFAILAEYMNTNFLKEYHEEMKFDVLWGNDIPAQSEKTPEKIMEDNQNLANYNSKNFKTDNLSILKTYNNQDGEFNIIDRYPGQLGEDGAIFKWFKYKFLPGGKNAQRPVLYIDGDESFTKTGVEKTIGNEISMTRANNYDFFAKFDAINRFAKSQELVTEGEAQIIEQDEDGFVSWLISKEPLKSAILVVANYMAPTEKVYDEDKEAVIVKNGKDVSDKTIHLPGDYTIKSEFVFDGIDFVEKEIKKPTNSLEFEVLKPSEFRIYLLNK